MDCFHMHHILTIFLNRKDIQILTRRAKMIYQSQIHVMVQLHHSLAFISIVHYLWTIQPYILFLLCDCPLVYYVETLITYTHIIPRIETTKIF